MRGQLGEIIRQFPEIQKSASAAKSAADTADATLKSSQKSFEIDERAWVGVAEWHSEVGPIENGVITMKEMKIILRNTGKTPATKLSIRCCSYSTSVLNGPIPDFDVFEKQEADARRQEEERIRRSIKDFKPNIQAVIRKTWQEDRDREAAVLGVHSGGALAPGAPYTINVSGWSFQMDTQNLYSNNAYLLGKITYQDIFDKTKERTTKFCLMRTSAGPEFTFCPESNLMD
jgi:hypothetical protein